MGGKPHWEAIYTTKDATQVSWYEEHPLASLQLIERTHVPRTAQIIDVGGGASTLVDDLLAADYQHITVLDISAAALRAARERLGPRAEAVTWLEADVTQAVLPELFYDVWHDRAVFHFLTDPNARHQYVMAVRRAVKPGGHVIVATFGVNGPARCSGLEVVRYSADALHSEFGAGFELVQSTSQVHQTPFATEQEFIYCYCRKH